MITISLLGGGGHASDVLGVVEAISATGDREYKAILADDVWTDLVRFDDRGDIKIVESIEAGATSAPFVVAVGYPATRRAIYDRAIAAGGESAAALVDPRADLGANVAVGLGSVVMGQVWISAGVALGAHVHVSYGSALGHYTKIGDFASIMPGACLGGDVTVGEGAFVGANATVLQGLTIGSGAMVGAGAVVTRDVPPDATVVGCPARVVPN